MNDDPQKNAQGGQDDTNREQPKGGYQQQQGQEATKQDTKATNSFCTRWAR